MEQSICLYCGDLFPASPGHKGQTCCKKVKCKQAKKAEWQRNKKHNDPVYRASQEICQKEWARSNPDYWKQYRERNPAKAERNRILQAIRNRKARSSPSNSKMDGCLIAKMDASNPVSFKAVGQFWLVPVIAKMDALKINIIVITDCYD